MHMVQNCRAVQPKETPSKLETTPPSSAPVQGHSSALQGISVSKWTVEEVEDLERPGHRVRRPDSTPRGSAKGLTRAETNGLLTRDGSGAGHSSDCHKPWEKDGKRFNFRWFQNRIHLNPFLVSSPRRRTPTGLRLTKCGFFRTTSTSQCRRRFGKSLRAFRFPFHLDQRGQSPSMNFTCSKPRSNQPRINVHPRSDHVVRSLQKSSEPKTSRTLNS